MGLPFTRDVDAYHRGDWSKWPVPEMPPMPALDEWAGPWKRDITDAPVDHERTAQLAELGGHVSTAAAGAPPYEGVSWGMPVSDVDVKMSPKAKVWDLSRSVEWVPGPGWLGWLFRTPVYPTVEIPVPMPRLRREGDPVGASDLHAYLYDNQHRVLYELLKIDADWFTGARTWGQASATVGYSGSGPGVARYDLSTPYSSKAPHGVVAAGVPQLPMTVRWDEIQAGYIGHAIFAGAANTARGWVGWARGGDGTSDLTPIHTGDILRLRPEVVDRFEPGSPRHTVAVAMATHGVFIGDKSTTGDPRGKGIGWTRTQDRRWWHGDDDLPPFGDMPLAVTDFELIVPQP